MLRKVIVFLLFFLTVNCIAGIANALPLKGDELFGYMASEVDSKNYSDVVYYIRGAADTLQDVEIDIPRNVTNTQVVQTLFGYMRENPQARELPAATVIRNALKKAYPLKK